MPCSCIELEDQYGQGECKCVHYRQHFPDCACERESVSQHSPGPVQNEEVLVRTIFRDQVIDTNGRPKPSYFRADPPTRGFSVDRMRITDLESLVVSKKADARYNGYLRFVKAYCRDVRALETNEAKRLFCVYDSATAENNAHADICQNLYLDPGTPNRKHRMMEIAWQLKMTFGLSQPLPPGL